MRSKKAFCFTIILAVFCQIFLKNFLFIFLNIGGILQPLEDFGYDCQRIYHPLLESCEDLWLDQASRDLYAACGDMNSRQNWVPAANSFNTSGRQRKDHFSVLHIDKPGEDGLYGLHKLNLTGPYQGANSENDQVLDLHGFSACEISDGRLQFVVINHRPPVDAISGRVLSDATATGANSTIEIFELDRGSSELEFIKTINDKKIIAPNNIAVSNQGRLIFTNDHSSKAGRVGPLQHVSSERLHKANLDPLLQLRRLESIYGTGSIVSCGIEIGECHTAASGGFSFPNGVVQGHDGLFYVSHFITGKITVHELRSNDSLIQVDEIKLGMPLDNLSIDEQGTIFVPGFPDISAVFKSLAHPGTEGIPSTIFAITKVTACNKSKYQVIKVLEDGEGRILPSATTVINDIYTGRLFLSGVASPFITVCQKP